jgi:hypothetical protein
MTSASLLQSTLTRRQQKNTSNRLLPHSYVLASETVPQSCRYLALVGLSCKKLSPSFSQ